MTWFYEPNPELGVPPNGLTLEFEAQPRDAYRLMRNEVIDVVLERAQEVYIFNPDIDYARDNKGNLLKPPSKLDPGSRAKLVLREMMETKTEHNDITFETEVAFFRSTEGSYVPLLFVVDPESLKWKNDVAQVTFFGSVETLEGQPIRHFEEQVKLTRTQDGPVVFEMPLVVESGNYTFNLGVLDQKKTGTRRLPIFVPGFSQDGLFFVYGFAFDDKGQPNLTGEARHVLGAPLHRKT